MTDGEKQDQANAFALESVRDWFEKSKQIFAILEKLPVSHETSLVIEDVSRTLTSIEPNYVAWKEANDKEADRQNAIVTERGY